MIYSYQKFNWTDLDNTQKKLFENIEIDILPIIKISRMLIEANMTDGQIEKLFSNAEKLSKENNFKTAFGKGISLPYDSLVKVNSILGKFGSRLQNSTPVKNFDSKFEQLKEELKAKLSTSPAGQKALSMIETLGNAAREHPIWQGAIIGLLTALSGLTLGPGSIPIMASLLKGATELIKGEKFSSAAGKGVYAGALGYLGAAVAYGLSSWFEGLRLHSIAPVGPSDLGFEKISFDGKSVSNSTGMSWTKWFKLSDAIVDQPTKSLINDTILRIGNGDLSAYDELLKVAKEISSPDYLAQLKSQLSNATAEKISNDGFLNSIKNIGKYVGAAAGGTTAGTVSSTTEGFNLAHPIMEGLWSDLTLQFGAGKLMKAWTALGKPTDSVEIAKMLADMGMPAEDIRYLFLRTGIPEKDVDDTLDALHNSEEDIELPFYSGIKEYDDEAKKILKSQGKEEFIKYWEQKISDIENLIVQKTKKPEKAPANSANVPSVTPSTQAPITNTPSDNTITSPENSDPISSNSPTGKQLMSHIRSALSVKDINKVRELLGPNQKLSKVLKTKILDLIDKSTLNKKDKTKAITALNKAVVTEKEIYNVINETFSISNMSWKDIGFDLVINNANKVILIKLDE